MNKILILIVCAFSISFDASAQMELAVQTSVDLPLDELKWIYKPSVGLSATLSKLKKYKKKASAFGVTLGYSNATPKEETFYYVVNDTEVGTAQYENMQAYQLTANFRRDFNITKQVELSGGFEFGIYYTKFAFESSDPYVTTSSSNFIGRAVLAPRIGLTYMFNKKMGVFFQTKYIVNLYKADEPLFKTQDTSDIANFYWSNSLGVTFRF